eukprot:TRINITY_DN566_c0_g1_i1.p1 TRINITY_DN566_c0_g1~~TRINITY_DN566_c0_g1_i1.p1  ORF type:complete len:261 (+),score=69.04 TRINITY_DN566_c0_g1_i1:101-784(+)
MSALDAFNKIDSMSPMELQNFMNGPAAPRASPATYGSPMPTVSGTYGGGYAPLPTSAAMSRAAPSPVNGSLPQQFGLAVSAPPANFGSAPRQAAAPGQAAAPAANFASAPREAAAPAANSAAPATFGSAPPAGGDKKKDKNKKNAADLHNQTATVLYDENGFIIGAPGAAPLYDTDPQLKADPLSYWANKEASRELTPGGHVSEPAAGFSHVNVYSGKRVRKRRACC